MSSMTAQRMCVLRMAMRSVSSVSCVAAWECPGMTMIESSCASQQCTAPVQFYHPVDTIDSFICHIKHTVRYLRLLPNSKMAH